MYFSKFIEQNEIYTRIPENISLEKYKDYKLTISSLLEHQGWEDEISFDNIKHFFLDGEYSLLQISFDLNNKDTSYLKKFVRKIFTVRYYENKNLKAYFEYYFDRVDDYYAIDIIPNENFEFYINEENILVINIKFRTSEIAKYIYR